MSDRPPPIAFDEIPGQAQKINRYAEPIARVTQFRDLQAAVLDELIQGLLAVRLLMTEIVKEVEGVVLTTLKAEAGHKEGRVIGRFDIYTPPGPQ